MSVLVRYDAACRALAEAKSVDEVKDLRDKAEAMRAYARQANNKQLEVDAAEIRMRAERRLGELIAAQKASVGLNPGTRGQLSGGSKVAPPGREVPTLAQAFGMEASEAKKLSARAQKLAAVPEERFESMVGEWRERVQRENERVTTRLLQEGENEQLKRQQIPIPEGKYGCIVIDPPWQMEKIEREVRPNQMAFDYPTMSEAELATFPLGDFMADDCHVFCWTTQKHLPTALRLFEAWVIKYVCVLVWHKSGGFQPVGLPQYNCEFVLYGRKGSPRFVETKSFFTCFEGQRREHSRKPDEFYEIIRRVTTEPRIDVFSRENRPGFDVWGNETAKFSEAVA